MKTEQLTNGNEIQKKIADLKEHLETIQTSNGIPITYSNATSELSVLPSNAYSSRKLYKEYLPISLPEIVDMYIARVQKEIKRLEQEFEKL